MEQKLNLIGWILFVICAGFFIVSSIQAHDVWYLTGSIIFLISCIVFIVALVIKK